MAQVYVSSTYEDLTEHRNEVSLAIRRMGHVDMAMEYYGAEERRPLDRCLADIAASELYVCLLAFRYGYEPPSHNRSMTELEIRHALDLGKDALFFLVSEDAPWPRKYVDRDTARIDSLRSYVGEQRLVAYFEGKDDLAARVGEAIHGWEKRRGVATVERRTDWDAYRAAVFEAHRWVRLGVIAGATTEQERRIPLGKVFVPPMIQSGRPARDVPDEILRSRSVLFSPAERTNEYSDETDGEEDDEADEAPVQEDDLGPSLERLPEPSLDMLCRERTQVVLGGPGSGKSTLLHYALLVLCGPDGAAGDPAPHLAATAVPFLVELRQYAPRSQGAGLVDYLVDNAAEVYGVSLEPTEIAQLLENEGRAVFLFDGLDEIFHPAERERVLRQFVAFSRRYPNANMVVTSRIVGYDPTELGLAEFQHYTLLDFTRAEVRRFVTAWYEYYTGEGDERDAAGLIQRIYDSPRLLELSGNPLLLTMMAVVHKHRELPEQRWRLYDRCTEVLLHDWEVKRKKFETNEVLPLNLAMGAKQKAELLQQVAMYMLEHGQSDRELNAIGHAPLMSIFAAYLQQKYDRSPGDAETMAEEILNHVRERTYVLAEIGDRIYGFVHRTFMEYFAACACRVEFNTRKADYRWLTYDLFGSHWQDDAWREVLLLIFAMLGDEDWPIAEIIDHLRTVAADPPSNLAFAAACLAEVDSPSGDRDNQWLGEFLVELVSAIDAQASLTPKKGTAGRVAGDRFLDEAVGAFGPIARRAPVPPAAREVIGRLSGARAQRARIAGWRMEVALRPRHEQLPYVLTALADRVEIVRLSAVSALGRDWPGNDRVGDALRETVATDTSSRVRQAALEMLQQSWPLDTGVLDAIEGRIPTETSYTFVMWLMRYLARNWPDNVRVLSMLLDLTGVEPSTWEYDRRAVMATGIEVIAANWSSRADPFALLTAVVASDDADAAKREAAITVLAMAWMERPEVWAVLSETAGSAGPDRVRRTATIALGRSPSPPPEVFDVLRARAGDDSPAVREAAILGTAWHWRSKPETSSLLLDRLRNDESAQCRAAAAAALAGHSATTETFLRPVEALTIVLPPTDELPSAAQVSKSLLWEVAVDDHDPDVRRLVLAALLKGWGAEAETAAFLCRRAVADPDPALRSHLLGGFVAPRGAMARGRYFVSEQERFQLAERLRLDPQVRRQVIEDRLANDEDSTVRMVALYSLAASWREDPDAWSLIRGRVRSDKDRDVRHAALSSVVMVKEDLWWHFAGGIHPDFFFLELAQYGGTDPVSSHERQMAFARARGEANLLQFLEDLVSDRDGGIRQLALLGLSVYWPNAAATEEVLTQVAREDRSAQVRSSAAALLQRRA